VYQVRPIGMGWARFEPVVTGAATHNAFSDLFFFFCDLMCCYDVATQYYRLGHSLRLWRDLSVFMC